MKNKKILLDYFKRQISYTQVLQKLSLGKNSINVIHGRIVKLLRELYEKEELTIKEDKINKLSL